MEGETGRPTAHGKEEPQLRDLGGRRKKRIGSLTKRDPVTVFINDSSILTSAIKYEMEPHPSNKHVI